MAKPRKKPPGPAPEPQEAPPRRAPPPTLRDLVGILTCTDGPDPGGVLSLAPGQELSVGRGRDNDLVLKDIVCSRHHIRVTVQERQVRVEDTGSGNGTRVNGRRVRDAVLADGDRVEVGTSTLTFSMSTPVATSPSAPNHPAGPWNDMRTLYTDPAALEREEMARRAARSAPPKAGATQPSPPVTVGGTPRAALKITRSTAIILGMATAGTLLLGGSIIAAVVLTQRAPAPTDLSVKMVDRAVELELQGESAKADALLETLRTQDPARYSWGVERVQAVRLTTRTTPPAPAPGAPTPNPVGPGEDPPRSTAREPARRPRGMSEREANDIISRANSLARDRRYTEATRLLRDVLNRAESSAARRKAESLLSKVERSSRGG
jgi:hypothetical protein